MRNFFFDGFFIANIKQLVKQPKLGNKEGYGSYLDEYNKALCRIMTQIDNIDEGKEDGKTRDDSRDDRRLFLFLLYKVKSKKEMHRAY